MKVFHRVTIIVAGFGGLALGLGACSGASSPQPAPAASASSAAKPVQGQDPKLEPFVGAWERDCPNSHVQLSIDTGSYTGYISNGTTKSRVGILLMNDEPTLEFAQGFNDSHASGDREAVAIKELGGGAQELTIGGDLVLFRGLTPARYC